MKKISIWLFLILIAFVNRAYSQTQTQPADQTADRSTAGLYSGKFIKRGQASTNYFLVLSQAKIAVMLIETPVGATIVQQGTWSAGQGKVEISWTEQDGKPGKSQMTFNARREELLYEGPNHEQFAPNGLHLMRADSENRSAKLAGPVWRWEETLFNDGKNLKPNGEPSKYTIQFHPDGNFNIHMDCNSGGGQYLIENNKIAIGSIRTTLVACPPGSLAQEFVRPLKSLGTFSLEAQNKHLKLKLDSATVTFVQQN